MRPGWKKYTGSDEQIAEIKNAKNGFIFRISNHQSEIYINNGSDIVGEWIDSKRKVLSVDALGHVLKRKNVTNYLICQPHPLADMICQQARTGQPVWVRTKDLSNHGWYYHDISYTNVNWSIPNAEYSFTPFEEEE